jgi:hypothetical protein
MINAKQKQKQNDYDVEKMAGKNGNENIMNERKSLFVSVIKWHNKEFHQSISF